MKKIVGLLGFLGVLVLVSGFPSSMPTAGPTEEVTPPTAEPEDTPIVDIDIYGPSPSFSLRSEKYTFLSGPLRRREKICGGRGMTWKLLKSDEELGIDFVGCDNCNAYTGQISCNEMRDLLCVKLENLPRPAYDVTCEGATKEPAFYCGWSGGTFATVPRVRGCTLSTRGAGDDFCEKEFGTGWKMMEFGDSWYTSDMSSEIDVGEAFPFTQRGGWNAYGFSNLKGNKNEFWVAINSQRANCWDFF